MEYVNIGIGLFILAIGLLVKKYPNLIAGYNTMSAERKKKVDIDGLSSWIRSGFIFMGILIIVGHYLLKYLGFEDLANNVMVIVLAGGTFIIAIVAQRYDHGKTE